MVVYWPRGSSPHVAMVDAPGRVRAVTPGLATVRTTAEGSVGAVQIAVRTGSNVQNLTHPDATRLPVLIASDLVWYGSRREFHQVYLKTRHLSLRGSPQLRYQVEMRYAEYNVTTVSGQRRMDVRDVHREVDLGTTEFDARVDMQQTSEYISPLHHVVVPVIGGMQMQYCIPGSDEGLRLFFRRERA